MNETPTVRRVPAVTITLRVEQLPLVTVESDSDEDFARLRDWVLSRPEQHQLIVHAREIRSRRGVT